MALETDPLDPLSALRETDAGQFVSPKTEVHLSSVYLELGLSSRSQLARALAETVRAD